MTPVQLPLQNWSCNVNIQCQLVMKEKLEDSHWKTHKISIYFPFIFFHNNCFQLHMFQPECLLVISGSVDVKQMNYENKSFAISGGSRGFTANHFRVRFNPVI